MKKDIKTNSVLKTKNLSIGYKSKKTESIVAANINIELSKGELVGLIGANGIGKSTLLRTLTNVQQCISGDVFINNIELNKLSNNDIKKAYVITGSRNFGVKIGNKTYNTIAPFVDLFNHDNISNTIWSSKLNSFNLHSRTE